MAKIIIAGDSIVVTSARTLEEIKTLEKYRPKALRLFEADEEGKNVEVFRIASTLGKGSINQYGASFGSATHDEEKLATITLSLPSEVEDAKEYAAETVGGAVMSLNKVEEQFAAALAEIESDKAKVLENITIA
jgi:hypothetical protein